MSIKTLVLDQATKCGWAIYDNNELIKYGTEDFSDNDFWVDTVKYLKRWFIYMIKKHQIEFVMLEDTTQQANPQVYKDLSKLLGVLENALAEKDMFWIVVTPGEWRKTCGIKGRKRKEQKANTIKFVKNTYGIEVDEDTADAIAIGYHGIKSVIPRIKVT